MSDCGVAETVPDIDSNDAVIIEAAIALNILNNDLSQEEVIDQIVNLSNSNTPESSQQIIYENTPVSSRVQSQESDLGISKKRFGY